MSIIVGTTQIIGNVVKLPPPAQFGSVGAVRLSNYTAFPVTVNNISGVGQSAQLIMPNQQMVYPTQNVSTQPTLVPTGNDTLTDVATNVFVEWSTEPQHDFTGVYPAQLSLPADVVAQAIFSAGVPNVLTTTDMLTAKYLQLFAGANLSGGVLVLPPESFVVVKTGSFGSTTLASNDTPVAPGWEIDYQWFEGATLAGGTRTPGWTNVFLIGTAALPPNQLSLNVKASNLLLTNTSATLTRTIETITGYNKVQPVDVSEAPPGGRPCEWSSSLANPSGNFVAATSYVLNTTADLIPFEGPALAEYVLGGSTIKGVFQMIYYGGDTPVGGTGNNLTIDLMDTSRMSVNTQGNQSIYSTPMAFPKDRFALVFNCSVSSAGSIALVRAISSS
jgi:hypothetical protein